jgi:hypothetical protein
MMRTIIFLGMGLCAMGALYEAEEERGSDNRLAPFLAALAIEAGIFLLRRHQGALLGSRKD